MMALVFGTIFGKDIYGHCSYYASVIVQLHDPIPQAYLFAMLSKYSVESMVNVMYVFLLAFYNAKYCSRGVKTTINH